MKSPNYFVVSPLNDEAYSLTKNIAGVDILMSSNIEDHTRVNRFAVVRAVPDWYDGDISVGDTLVVHHNVFRVYYDMKGNKKNSWNHFRDNIYLIDQLQFFLYKKADGDWIAPYPYCFVSPVEQLEDKAVKRTNIMEDNLGVVEYVHNHSELKPGDNVYFNRDMEYEFTIDDKRMYRMKSSDVCLKI